MRDPAGDFGAAQVIEGAEVTSAFSLRRAGSAEKGAILSRERMAPFRSPKRTQGALPLDPAALAVCSLKSCTRCAIGCGVHGFAMNPCVSLHVATAPYYREARVTLPRRRTACRMRHCYARRIDETGGKRKLVSTPTRSAERQRIIEAEANRIVNPMAASVSNAATQALSLRRHESCSSSRLPIKAFLLGFQRGHSLLQKRMTPLSRFPARRRGTKYSAAAL